VQTFAQSSQDSLELYRNSIKVQEFYENYGDYVVVKRRHYVKLPHWKNWKARMRYKGGDKSKYYQKVDEQMYRQREIETTVLNIAPTEYIQYRNDVIGSPMHADDVGLYLYSMPPRAMKKKPRVVSFKEIRTPKKRVKVPSLMYNWRDEVVRDWVNVPNLKIVSRRRNGQSIPFAIENSLGERIPYGSTRVPRGFQYPETVLLATVAQHR